ncbi:MAG: peptidyl-prolyl cis-trans isomerase [Planctomycetota bacterium]
MVPTSAVFERFRKDRVSRACDYVRFDASEFADDDAKVEDKVLQEHYTKHNRNFMEPIRKNVEFLHAEVEPVRRRVLLTEGEKRSFYEAEKDAIFRLPPEEKEKEKDGDKKDADKKDGDKKDGDKKDEDKKDEDKKDEDKKDADKKDTDEKDADEKDEEKKAPPVRYKPFKDAAVQEEIEKRLSERKARDFVEQLLGRVAGTLKRLEESIRADRVAYPNVDDALKKQIDFARMMKNIANSKDWMGSYIGYRIRSVHDDAYYSRDEIREAYGPVGPRIADKAWELRMLQTSDVIPVPGGFVVFRVFEFSPEYVRNFDQIRDRVLEDYRLQASMDRAHERAKKVAEQMKGSTFDAVAREENLKVLRTAFFRSTARTISGDGERPPVGEAPKFIAAAFLPQAKTLSGPVLERELGSVFVLRAVDERYPSPAEMPEAERKRFVDEERREVWNEVNKAWGDEFKKHHDIKDRTRDRGR